MLKEQLSIQYFRYLAKNIILSTEFHKKRVITLILELNHEIRYWLAKMVDAWKIDFHHAHQLRISKFEGCDSQIGRIHGLFIFKHLQYLSNV